MRVLIVDDAPEVIAITRVILEDQGIGCISASDGGQALRIARGGAIHLILLDVVMPKLDGFSLCAQLKTETKTAQIPIIFITGRGDDESIARGFELGAVDYITKPFNRYELLSRINTHIQIISQKRELSNIIAVKNKVLSLISHELRNQFSMLSSVYSLMEADMSLQADEGMSSHIAKLQRGIEETRDLFDNLIIWSKKQRGTLEDKRENLPVAEIVEEIGQVLTPAFEGKNIKFRNRISPELHIMADKLLFSMVIRNFLSNAIKFSHRGGYIEAFGDIVYSEPVIKIRDFGIGMDAEIQHRIFKIDENPSTQGTEQEPGTGIGLIICKDFAERMGARIDYNSELGQGTTFQLSFPPDYVVED